MGVGWGNDPTSVSSFTFSFGVESADHEAGGWGSEVQEMGLPYAFESDVVVDDHTLKLGKQIVDGDGKHAVFGSRACAWLSADTITWSGRRGVLLLVLCNMMPFFVRRRINSITVA